MSLEISPAREQDEAFVLDSWLRSYYDTPAFAAVPRSIFFPGARAMVTRILETSPSLLTIRDAQRPDWIAAWVCTSVHEGKLVLHWSYTKFPYRRRGYFSALLRRALDAAPVQDLAYTLHSRFDPRLERMGFSFESIGRLLKEK